MQRQALLLCALATQCVDVNTCFASVQNLVRVHLFSTAPFTREVTLKGPIKIQTAESQVPLFGTVTIRNSHGSLVTSFNGHLLPNISGPKLSVKGKLGAPVFLSTDKFSLRGYRGAIVISATGSSDLSVINNVPKLDYVISVVGSEVPAKAPPEMLKAQAILAQTLIARTRDTSQVADSTETQFYSGSGAERPEVVSATKSVQGKLLIYKRSPVSVFYHSTCAGRTSSASEYFGLKPGSLPYLKSVPCDHCKKSPFYHETKRLIAMHDWQREFGNRTAKVVSRDQTGRPLKVSLGENLSNSGYQFWLALGKKFGWDKAPGTRFSITPQEDGMLVTSTGAGHGVGLCQWGAIELAKEGKTHLQILNYYYPGCTVEDR